MLLLLAKLYPAQMEGQNIVPSVVGPIGHSPSDLQLMVEMLLNAKPWEHDPTVVPLPWQGEKQAEVQRRARSPGLCFGVMWWDGVVAPHPPIQRVMEEIVAKLKEKGHEVRILVTNGDGRVNVKLSGFRSLNGRLHLTLRLSRYW